MRTREFVVSLLVAVAALPPSTELAAQAPPHPRPLLSEETAGGAALILLASFLGDQGLRGEVLEHRTDASRAATRLGNAFGDPRYVLPALGAGFLAGRFVGSPGLSRATLHAGEAAIVAGGIATALKFAVGRRRPSGDGDADELRPFSGCNSFPSGHTAVAFAVATAIANETPDIWSDAALYGIAGLTGMARLNDDRHWISDVFAGALVGHLSARWLARGRGWLTVRPGGIAASLEF